MKQNTQDTMKKITKWLDRIPDNATVKNDLLKYLQKCIRNANIGRMNISGTYLRFGDHKIDFKGRHLTLKIFALFVKRANKPICRKDLIQSVYGVKNFDKLSVRRQSSFNHNIVKLVSRSRILASTQFANKGIKSIEWFPYDPLTKSWQLIREKSNLD